MAQMQQNRSSGMAPAPMQADVTSPDQTPSSASAFASSVPTAPSLSLPSGGGAIRGMGEKFDVNLATGTGTASIPIRLSPGRGNLQPQLSLTYDSGAGNGPYGIGWRLSGPKITRKTAKGLPRYNDNGSDLDADVFLFSDSEDLVPRFKLDSSSNIIFGTDGNPRFQESTQSGYLVRRYSPRIETSFSRIERFINLTDSSDIFWRTTSNENITCIYGRDDSSRIFDPNSKSGGAKRIFSWLISEMYDSKGNAVLYNFKAEDSANVSINQASETNRSALSRSANRYLKSVQYGNRTPNRDVASWNVTPASTIPQASWAFSVVFDYGEHDLANPKPNDTGLWRSRFDPFSDYHSGYEVRTYRLCQRILMFHHFTELGNTDYLVSSTNFSYTQNGIVTYLNSMELSGYTLDPSGTSYTKQALPPTTFEYSLFPGDDELAQLAVQDIDSSSLENLPIGVDGVSYQWIDLDGEGLSGLLAQQGGGWFYKRNSSANNFPLTDDVLARPRFDPLEILHMQPSRSISGGSAHFGDVSGAAKLDLIQMETGSWGYYERADVSGWVSFRTFKSFPTVDPRNPDLKYVDLTGDGLADILIYSGQVYTWFPSLGEDGYGEGQSVTQPLDENLGPICVFSDREQTIYLADMSGDGMIDLVRIRNGDICYWPNSGYGQFGSLVQMDNAPWFDSVDLFNQKRIHLADVDGSGTTDILYIGSGNIDMYLNMSGNGFSDVKHLGPFPSADDQSTVDIVDLLGNGTSCIVWSSTAPSAYPASMRYIDIMGGKKPHLLTKLTNNFGTESHISYAPSTKFYLQDKQNGIPWVTKLPFPVQCVEKLDVFDHIGGNHFVSSFSYHHGCFDGFEREFRGFGMVERWDTDDFATMSTVDSTNVDSSWHVPPVHTKTWFHTGEYLGNETISRRFATEYFGAPSGGGSMSAFYATLLDDTILPVGLNGDEQRETCRALKGHVLRTEIYADDGGPKALIPYTVVETSFTIAAIQSRLDAHLHSVYFTHSRETISYYYERNIDDPRIVHEMVLDADDFGDVTRSLKIAYGRQPGQTLLTGVNKEIQETPLFLYSETDFTNVIDAEDYRTPMPCEVRQFQITGFNIPSGASRFSFADFSSDAVSTLVSINFEQQIKTSLSQKRLVKQSRILYRSDNLAGLLTVGKLESMALPGVAFDLAFSLSLLTSIYKTADSPSKNLILDPKSTLGSLGGYIDLDNDGNWWKQTSQVSYSSNPSATAVQELQVARSGFFLPRCFTDPFQNNTYVDYDANVMFPVTVTDAVGNMTSSSIDYRVLQPSLVIDTNGNRSAVAFDAFGLVAGTARMGKVSENLGDNLDSFKPDLTQEDLDLFFAAPTGPTAAILLGNASSRVVYDLNRYSSSSLPSYTATISRESHAADPVPPSGLKLQVKFSYSDGFGRTIQSKFQAKPGPLINNGPVVNRWVGSSWIIYNNKGKPVKQYEPFFDDTHDFKYNMKIGVTPIIFYDPRLRVVATLRADHAVQKTVFSAWSQTAYDFNDTVLLSDPKEDPDIGHFFDSLPEENYKPSWYDIRKLGQLGPIELSAAQKSALHANTPKVSHIDPLARVILEVEDNGGGQTISTGHAFDIQGNEIKITDALNRTAMQADFNITRDLIHRASMEAGERWMLADVLGKDYLNWNSRDIRLRTVYDVARRPIESWMSDTDATEVMVAKNIYGETLPNALASNLRGRLVSVMDQAGVLNSNGFDFKGNLLASTRKLAVDYKDVLNWSASVDLEADLFVSSTTYDALDRPVISQAADNSATYRVYNETARLNEVFVNPQGEQESSDPSTWTSFVTNVDYNSKYQITNVTYGNGTATTRTYDPLLFRLRRMQTSQPTGGALQDLNYTYDSIGNITFVQDNAQQSIFFRNRRVDPSSDYTYDPLYRLIGATGREHLGQTNGAPSSPTAPGAFDVANTKLDSPGDGNAVGTYTESYNYDPTGNILSMSHKGNDPNYSGWKRTYVYNEPSQIEASECSNRLSATTVGSVRETYKYDVSGNITAMAHLSKMQWDFQDQLRATSKQIVTNGGTPETTYYVYDSRGERVRKVTESQSGTGSSPTPTLMSQCIYLSGLDMFQKFNAAGTAVALERVTFKITGESKRIANIETRTQGTDDGVRRLIRYQLDNQLGSSCIELDDQARIISYEEYFPFGSTSYQAVANQTNVPKRYRYTGKERDEESGFYYHGARYYAPWLGRWTASDPAGLVDGPNTYVYATNRVTMATDPTGKQTAPPPPTPAPPSTPAPAPPVPPVVLATPPGVPSTGPSYNKYKNEPDFQDFERDVKLLVDPGTPPHTPAEKSKDVDVNTEAHDEMVKKFINRAIQGAVEQYTDPSTHTITGTEQEILHYALFNLIIPIRQRSFTDSQSLVFRDGDHWFAGRNQEWQTAKQTMEKVNSVLSTERTDKWRKSDPSVGLGLTLSAFAGWYYDLKKISDYKDGKVTNGVDTSSMPSAAPGGRDWAELGSEAWFRGRSDWHDEMVPEGITDTPWQLKQYENQIMIESAKQGGF